MKTYSEIKKALNSKEISPLEITNECIRRIEAYEPKVSALFISTKKIFSNKPNNLK